MTEKPKVENTIFFTYFDKAFILRGLALHESLVHFLPKAKLWIFAFDDYTKKILRKMKLKGVRVISIDEMEDPEMLAVKPTRTKVEYMWTSTPSIPLYIFRKNKNVSHVIYLDADEYFFSSPAPIFDEMGSSSLLAVEHRYPPGREGLNEQDGRFNVAVNVFKRDKVGIKCLERWRKQCLDWCYWRLEDGKLGDQLYLNEWPKLYGKNLIISQNLGVNVAPWNVSQYKITRKDGQLYVDGVPVVCYHFHQFQVLGSNNFKRVYGYPLSREVENLIYKPYEAELRIQYRKLKKTDPHFEIVPPVRYSAQIIRQMLGKYFGPAYWRLVTLYYDMRSRSRNDK